MVGIGCSRLRFYFFDIGLRLWLNRMVVIGFDFSILFEVEFVIIFRFIIDKIRLILIELILIILFDDFLHNFLLINIFIIIILNGELILIEQIVGS